MKQPRISQKSFYTSIGLILLSTICLAVSISLWQYLTTLGSLSIVVFVRFVFPWLFVSIWLLTKHLRVRVASIWPHLLRAVIILGAQYALLYVLAHTNLLLATLLYSTSGLFSPILLYLFLRVRASFKAILSIIISFVGVAIALGSWSHIISLISLIGLLSGLLTAGGQIIQHRTSKSDHPMISNFLIFGLCSLLSFILLLFNHSLGQDIPHFTNQISLPVMGIILAFSFLTIANQTLKNSAFKFVNKATTLTPFLYTTIVFSGLIDWIWHGIIPQLHNIIGVCIIIVGGVIMSIRKP